MTSVPGRTAQLPRGPRGAPVFKAPQMSGFEAGQSSTPAGLHRPPGATRCLPPNWPGRNVPEPFIHLLQNRSGWQCRGFAPEQDVPEVRDRARHLASVLQAIPAAGWCQLALAERQGTDKTSTTRLRRNPAAPSGDTRAPAGRSPSSTRCMGRWHLLVKPCESW